jgi:imidazole glycerol-phosphate synthase subunit HisH
MSNTKITIIDYGLGNIKSIHDAFSLFHENVKISKNIKSINSSDGLILPGVGSFKKAIDLIKKDNLDKLIKKQSKNSVPILGICLGMQLLFESSDEFGFSSGLSLISGKVKKLNINNYEKLPNIGWRKLLNKKKNSPFMNNIKVNDQFYFLHSFYCSSKFKKNVIAETNYGTKKFASIVQNNNIYGCQFHPEKSGNSGLKLIRNFVEIVKNK